MGKAVSKLKKRKTTSNLSWTRFGSLISLKSKHRLVVNEDGSATVGRNPRKPHLAIGQWLAVLELQQYEDLFNAFGGVEELLDHSEADIRDLGVKISSHRAMIISSLTALRAKYHGSRSARKDKAGSLQRHSLAVDSRNKIQQEDTVSDLRVVSEAIQSKSLNNLIMEPCMDPSMDAAALRKALEWELSLDNRDLRSHAWYHGAIPRSRAEDIVREEGGFLVRDCTSQPGNFVLTCRTKHQPLHFVINKTVLQPDTVYERVQYQFEDDAYDTVPDLITFYVGSGKPISAASGAKIQFPVNRLYPLSFYAAKYPTPLCHSRLVSPVNTPMANTAFRYTPYNSGSYKPSPSPTRMSFKDTPPRLPSKKQRSHSLTPQEANSRACQEKCNSADGVITQSPLMTRSIGPDAIINSQGMKFSTHSLPRSPCTKLTISPSSITLGRNAKNMPRVTSDPALSPCAERRHFGLTDEEFPPDSPPPKPSRVPSLMRSESKDYDNQDGRNSADQAAFLTHGGLQRVASYHASGSDSGNGSGDSAQSSAAGDAVEPPPVNRNSGVVIKNPRYNIANSESTTTLKNFEFDFADAEERLLQMPQPELDLSSRFDLENFHTLLLPTTENKPLDSSALKGIRLILKESGPRILANHLTRIDLDLILGKEADDGSKNFGNGIELLALPHGHQFRLDLIERTECLKLIVAVTILTCSDEIERAEVLNKWIEIAIDTKTALGNLYGFCGIMLGVCTSQIQKLDTTWHTLRQKHTDSAFNFEAKLKPTLKNMNDCSNPQAPNTTIPHLLPFVLLQERCLDDFLGHHSQQHVGQQQQQDAQNSLVASVLSLWELNTQDFGLSTLFAHMEAARKFAELTPTFRRNAKIVLGEARMEELTMDVFRTEFQLKFLWGSRGAYVSAPDRHAKFEQVLSVLADKYCNSVPEESEV